MVQFFDPTQESEIKRRRMIGEQLLKQGVQKPTEVVSGYAVPQSGLEGISQGLSGVLGAYAMGSAGDKEQEMATQRQRLLAEALSAPDAKQAGALLAQDPAMAKEGISLYGDALKADADNAAFEKEAALKRELQRMRGQVGGQPIFDANGEPLLDANGNIILNEAPRKLSATEQKSFEEQQQKIGALESSQDAFGQIKEYQGKPMYSGFGAEVLAAANRIPGVGALINDEKASNTTAYQNLIKTGQYKQLASTFPGAISNSEREALEKLGAIASYTPQEQAKIVRDSETGIAKLLEKAKLRASDIASGRQYEKAIAGTGTSIPTQPPIPEGATATNHQTGARMKFTNGAWGPM